MKHPRRHLYPFSEVIRVACLAVTGSSAAEIADALGRGPNTSRIFRILRLHGIRLVPKTHAQIAFTVVISREAMIEIERVCDPYGADPQMIVARAAEYVARDSAQLREVVKGAVKK